MLFLFVGLKVPLIALCLLVWWAIRQEPDYVEPDGGGGSSSAAPARAAPAAASGAAPTATPPRSRRPACARSARGRASSSDSVPACPRPPPSSPTARSAASSTRAESSSTHGIPALVQPASVDLRLGDSFRVFHNHRAAAIDLRDPPTNLTEEVVIEGDEPFVIHPGEFALGRTREYVEIPDDIVARIEGKCSLGRLGLIVHATAGFVDPGFKGTLTLEITNLTRVPIKLYTGLPIAQLSFMALDAPAEQPVRLAGARLALPGPDRRDGVPLRTGRPVAFRAMLATLLTLAVEVVEEEEPSKTLFYVLGLVAAGWAVVLFAIGMRSPTFPGSPAAQRGVIAISVLVVLGAMASAVITG